MMREIVADVISATVFSVTWNMIDDTGSYLEEMHYRAVLTIVNFQFLNRNRSRMSIIIKSALCAACYD